MAKSILGGMACAGTLAVACVGALSGAGASGGHKPAKPVRTAAVNAHAAHGQGSKHAPSAAAPHANADHGTGLHWSYEGVEGPVHWGHLSPEWLTCTTGQMQSPVELSQANTQADIKVATDYHRGALNILNNGHTVQANFTAGSSLQSGGRAYALKQVHFHAPSEHQVNGRAYPLEAHFVHADASGRLAVLGVFFEEGPTNLELAKLIVAAPRTKGGPNTVEGFTFDPRALLPATLSVWRYMGSLTTPPCSEGVNWHVATQPIYASASQIAELARVMGQNARPVQALNNRLLIAAAN